MDLIYAGVGARQTPSTIQESMTSMAWQMSAAGWHLRSGFADGADKAFGAGAAAQAEESKGVERYTMYLPWSGYNRAPVGDDHFQTVLATDDLFRVALAAWEERRKMEDDLPEWRYLKDTTKLLMIRNVPIVAGPKLDRPAACVIGYTANAKGSGGTGHTFQVAKLLKVPVFDLASAYDQRAVVEFINGYEQQREQIPWSYDDEEQDFARARLESLGMANN